MEFPSNLKSKSSFKSSSFYGYVSETIFEPLNALLLTDTTEAFIPFVAGWVTDEKDEGGNYLTKDFEKIDIYKIDGEEKIFHKLQTMSGWHSEEGGPPSQYDWMQATWYYQGAGKGREAIWNDLREWSGKDKIWEWDPEKASTPYERF